MSFTLGIITARGGSKGIKDKNTTLLNDKPLIHYTIEEALQSSCLDDFVLSTDSQAIIDCAAEAGLECEQLRPDHLATDDAKSCDVLRHEIEQYEASTGRHVDTIILLQPTSPLRLAQDIDAAFDVYTNSEKPSLISCYESGSIHPRIMYQKNKEKGGLSPLLQDGHMLIRRQQMEVVYIRNGSLYIIGRDYFMETGRTVCDTPDFYEMPKDRSVNIDAQEDLDLAEFYLQRMGGA